LSYKHDDREAAYEFLRVRARQGQQAFVVYPLIEESPQLMLRSAKAMYKEFKERVFKDLRVGLIHGRLDREEQQGVMRRFREGDLDILVATTVLEVGIDVPNATVMLIEHADRFGLSQLHQMRGRVGRGTMESFCLLVADPATEEARARLDALVNFSDGFRIAEEDLKIRGPGEFFGERQHGLAELRIADPLRQLHILKAAREDAVRVITGDPLLKERVHQEIRRQLHRRFPGFEKFIEVG
jgi:ATP-dependent DNA helicase RecG